MIEHEGSSKATQQPGRPWYLWDVWLSLGFVLSYAGFLAGIVVFLILPFTRFGLPPDKTFTRGLRQYMIANVDLASIRAWLNTLDPKRCTDYTYDLASGATIEDWWPEAAPWAKTVTPLNPVAARLALDSSAHPAIRIRWVGFLNGWGFVVDSERMQTPPSDFLQRSEYRLPLDSGAYIWHERGGLWRRFRFLVTDT